MSFTISKEEMLSGMNTMNSLGARLTGNRAHSDFIKYLKSEIEKMGIQIFSDPFYFKRWEEKAPQSIFSTEKKKSPFPFPPPTLIRAKRMKTESRKSLCMSKM